MSNLPDQELLRRAQLAQTEGRWPDAEAAYRQVLASSQGRPADASLLVNWGQVLRKVGKHAEGMEAYRLATTLPDAPAEAWFNLGNALAEEGAWSRAQACFESALALSPTLEQAALQLARCAIQLGRLQEARERFAAILRINPGNFQAWLEAGHLCRQHGTPAQVIASYRRAVAAAPERWLGHATLARALEEQGQRDAAAVHYWHAQRCPDAGGGLFAHLFMGRARLSAGDATGAVEALAHALRCSPGNAACELDLADALMRLGGRVAAQELFARVGQARDAGVLARLAEVLFRHNEWEQAESILRGVAARQPADPKVLLQLASLLVESWRPEEGLAWLDRAEELSGTRMPAAGGLRAAAAGKIGDSTGCLDRYRALGQEEGPLSPFLSCAAMASLYSEDLTASESANLHRQLFAPLGTGARVSFANSPVRDRPLRIGYVTADLHLQHPVNLFMQPVLARHDAAQFEVTIYFTGVSVDEQTQLARSRVARWREVTALSDAQLARVVEQDGIDILVDLMGHTVRNRRVLFAQRAAPVQTAFLGYPSSTGLPNMDWIVADAQTAPSDMEFLFSERVARLPHAVFCYAPEDEYPSPAFGASLAKRQLTFGSFNNLAKLTGRTVSLWAKVLAEVPKSRLLLKAPTFMDPAAARRIVGRFAAAGVDPARIECRGPSGLAEMMAEYADVDIALDTFPYNGGTTTWQALWMGVPVVTLAGEGFWSRMGASILHGIGRAQWVAETPEQFVKIAKQLASKRPSLLAEKKNLRATLLSSPAADIDAYVRALEGLYRMMWTQWCDEPRA